MSESVTLTGHNTADITGQATLRGITVPVTLHVELTHMGAHPVAKFINYYNGEWLGFHASAEIDTAPFGFAVPVGKLEFDISTEMKAQ